MGLATSASMANSAGAAMLEEYFSYSPLSLVPEARRAFALTLAVNATHDRQTTDEILAAAKLFEGWLKEVEAADAKPKLKAVKSES